MRPTASGSSTEIRWIPADLRTLDDNPSDLLILSAFADERPLTGLSGLVDWRLAGTLSRWRLGGLSSGSLGERVLTASHTRLSAPRLLFVGLGPRAHYRSDRALALAEDLVDVAYGLNARSLTLDLLRLEALATPLERTGPRLAELLRSPGVFSHVTFISEPESISQIKDGINFFGRR